MRLSEIAPVQKSNVMTETLKDLTDHEFANEIIRVTNPDHKCGNDSCHGTCHYLLKQRAFDLLFANIILEVK